MLARRLATILPARRRPAALETTRVPRVAGLTSGRTAIATTRPFQAPHHSISEVGVIGGGQQPLPGEVSLAHHGILFLDALPELQNPPGVTGSNGSYTGCTVRRAGRLITRCAGLTTPAWPICVSGLGAAPESRSTP
jgi:hypothetical protein